MNSDEPLLKHFLEGIDERLTIPEGFIQEFKKIITESFFTKQQTILIEKTTRRLFCLVNKGCLRQYVLTERYEEITKWFWFAGDTYSIPPLTGKKSISTYFEVLTETTILSVSMKDLKKLIRNYPQMKYSPTVLTSCFEELLDSHLDEMKALSATERYKKLFSKRPELFNSARQKDIAQFLGIKADTLSRIRKSMK